MGYEHIGRSQRHVPLTAFSTAKLSALELLPGITCEQNSKPPAILPIPRCVFQSSPVRGINFSGSKDNRTGTLAYVSHCHVEIYELAIVL